MISSPGAATPTHGPLMLGQRLAVGSYRADREYVVGEPCRADDGAHPGPVARVVGLERIEGRVLPAVGLLGSPSLPAAATMTMSFSTAA